MTNVQDLMAFNREVHSLSPKKLNKAQWVSKRPKTWYHPPVNKYMMQLPSLLMLPGL